MQLHNLNPDSEAKVSSWRAGRVDVQADGTWQLSSRLWGKTASLAEVWLFGKRRHQQRDGDSCTAYWHTHPGYSQFLCLGYIVSNRETSFRTLYRTQRLVAEIARVKNADAVLCDVVNGRISDRVLGRWGWQRHLEKSKHRLFIRRFYGEYPAPERWIMAPART